MILGEYFFSNKKKWFFETKFLSEGDQKDIFETKIFMIFKKSWKKFGNLGFYKKV